MSEEDFVATRSLRANRRRFLQYAGGAGLAAPQAIAAAKTMDNIYTELGVRTIINGRGVATFYSGTLMPPEVHRAMERASEHFVEIVELQRAVRARLARYAGAEAAMVCSGSAACISQANAGCIAGTDVDQIANLPETTGKKNAVIVPQPSVGDGSIALVGARIVLVQSRKELESAINANTAMIEIEYGDERVVKVKDAIAIAKAHGVPVLLDAAPICPPFERLKTLSRV